MRTRTVALALISATSLLVACGTDPIDSTGHPQDGGAGGATSTGGGGHGGSAVATGGGGNAGSAMGGSGGTGGSLGGSSGAGGAGGTVVVEAGPEPSLCDGKAKKTLPYAIGSDYRAVTVIGSATSFTIAANPDCTTPYANPEAGSDAATADATSADAADATQAVSDPDAADSTADAVAADAGAADASAVSDAKSDAAPVSDAGPPPACYEFHYNPDTCESGVCWAGAIFQPGTMLPGADAAVQTTAGICIELGATGVEFWARANRNMARVKFGSTREGVGATEFWTNITTEWAKYTVAIPVNEPYNEKASTTGGVWNGFSVVVEPGDHAGGTTIEVKDIVWKK